MSISDLIQRKKQEFFVARDTDKLELQKAALAKQRKELQQKANLQDEVRKEQRQIRELKSAPARKTLSGISQGLKRLKGGAERMNKAVSQFGGSSSGGPFTPTNNPFGPDKKTVKPASSGKKITINIKE